MHRGTLLLLLLVLAGLGGLALWQLRHEAGGDPRGEERLCPGLLAARVDRIRIDNVGRAEVVVLERDAQGRWRIVDPFDFPAEERLPRFLAGVAEENLLQPSPEGLTKDPAELGLAPPRAVVSWRERLDDGSTREHQVELGRTDPDRQRVIVRTRGRVGTTLRNLETAVDRFVQDYRGRSILSVPPRSVLELSRTGDDPRGGGPRDAEMLLEADGWRLVRPRAARLDPPSAALLVGICAGLSAEGFLDDPTRTPAELGFGTRSLRIELGTASGARHEVEIALSEAEGWLARRPGEAWIWRLDPSAAAILCSPPEEWIDRALVRARREELARIEIARGTERIALRSAPRAGFELELEGRWREADSAAVVDLLGSLERSAFGGLLEEPAAADPRARSLRLELQDGRVQALELCGTRLLESGETVRELRRLEDGVLGWVDPAFESLFTLDPTELLSPRLLPGVEESTAERLVLVGLDARRVFLRRQDGVWIEEGRELPARELTPWLDPLFFLRAARRLPAGAQPALEEPLRVEIVDRAGESRSFTLGLVRSPGGEERVEIEVDGLRAVADRPALHEGLSALLRR